VLSTLDGLAMAGMRFKERVEPPGKPQERGEREIAVARVSRHCETGRARTSPPANRRRGEWLGAELPEHDGHRLRDQPPVKEGRLTKSSAASMSTGAQGDIQVFHAVLLGKALPIES
jgi:hypothetical protein